MALGETFTTRAASLRWSVLGRALWRVQGRLRSQEKNPLHRGSHCGRAHPLLPNWRRRVGRALRLPPSTTDATVCPAVTRAHAGAAPGAPRADGANGRPSPAPNAVNLGAMRRPAAGAAFPCLVVPAGLTFVADDESTHKQVLTIYNPFEFPLKYKILSTAPARYVARPYLGTMKPSSSLDVVIRLKDASVASRDDKLMVEIADAASDAVLGKKVILCRVVPAHADDSPVDYPRTSEADAAMISQLRASQKATLRASPAHGYASQAIVGLVVLACIGVIVAPTAAPGAAAGITHFAFSSGQQLGAAFILGMVTLAILRAFG